MLQHAHLFFSRIDGDLDADEELDGALQQHELTLLVAEHLMQMIQCLFVQGSKFVSLALALVMIEAAAVTVCVSECVACERSSRIILGRA